MCGIGGWVDWKRDLTGEGGVLDRMAATLVRRGPDAGGVWISPRAALVNRRLIVVDPAGGAQPMTRRHAGRAYTIVYNGELYNTAELRRDLEARGYAFTGYSDTEALLFSYIEWGRECLERLNGIFAFAIWSETDESLFLARDRLGVKPLFYAVRGGALVFGSELKTLLAPPAVEPELDEEGLAEVFLIGPARTPGHGVFRGISELRAGHWLRYDRGGVRVGRYWALESRPHGDDLETTAATVRDLLRDTVERQLVSDVPVCTLLSGGIDSSAVTALAAAAFRREERDPIGTYSVDFVDMERDFRPSAFQTNLDAPWVRRVSEWLGTRHRAVVLDTPELVEHLTTALFARDLPGMADVDTSLYLFSRDIKREATVALSGEAADEVFGGYPWLYREDAVGADTFPWSRRLADRVSLLSPAVVERIRPWEYVADRYREALAEVPRLPGETGREARMRELQYLNLSRFLPTLLDRKDRMSMYVGLEVRVPYCDHRLVEYAWNIPWEMKNCDGVPKGILRRALAGVLPDDVLARRKSPYPSTHNPAYGEAMRGRLAAVMDDPGSPLRPLVDEEAVRRLAAGNGTASDLPWFGQLMGVPQLCAYLVQVDTWLREYRVRIR